MSSIYISEAIAEHIVRGSQSELTDLIASFDNVQKANEKLNAMTGVAHFFDCKDDFETFTRLVLVQDHQPDAHKQREYGDFQTPPELAKQICDYLASIGVEPDIVIEPTHGLGNFIFAALDSFPSVKLIYGVEIQERYCWSVKIKLLVSALTKKKNLVEIQLHHANIFEHKFSTEISQVQNVLILGNPPWVTNAELGGLDSSNLPKKQNIRALNGLDALTGKSNFDICESILIKLLNSFSTRQGTLAMLCKNATARNLIELLGRRRYTVTSLRMLEIDAMKTFGVAVDACLLIMQLGAEQAQLLCQVSSFEEPDKVKSTFVWLDGKSVSNTDHYQHTSRLEGTSLFTWRQGVKHDAAKVMELKQVDGDWVNGLNEVVKVEESHIYDLLKSSDLQRFDTSNSGRSLIVTQKKIGEPTEPLRLQTPLLWAYLNRNITHFEKRLSVIYKNKPAFSIFGVGEYSFKPYKVAISGLYKHPNFALVVPICSRPVMLDDTCYFLGFDTYKDALFTASVLNSEGVKQFLLSITFNDAKRPFTKDALMRIDLLRAAEQTEFRQLSDYWEGIHYKPLEKISEQDFADYKNELRAFLLQEESPQLAFEL